MRKIKLYIAISLDGKIAKPKGEVDWLDDVPNPDKLDYGYMDFYSSIDTVLMGNTTYQQVLGFDVPYPYPGIKSYVFTRNSELKADENVTYISENIPAFIADLKKQEGKDIWLVGGGELNSLLLKHRLIDEIFIFVMPVLLGGGIPVFNDEIDTNALQLVDSQTFKTGVIGLAYKVKATK